MKCPQCEQEETHFLSCTVPEYLLHHTQELQAKYEAAMKKVAELSRSQP